MRTVEGAKGKQGRRLLKSCGEGEGTLLVSQPVVVEEAKKIQLLVGHPRTLMAVAKAKATKRHPRVWPRGEKRKHRMLVATVVIRRRAKRSTRSGSVTADGPFNCWQLPGQRLLLREELFKFHCILPNVFV